MKKLFITIIIFVLFQKVFAANAEKIPFFLPPAKWEIANPKLYNKFIKVSFVKNEKSICRPTINLALEKTSLTLEAYVNEAKKTHLKDPHTTCRILGEFILSQGKAYICQISKNTNSINFELLQMLFVKDGYAYIITGASKKEEMLKNYKTFTDVFSSFKLIDDLFSLILDKTKKDELIQKFNTLSFLLKTSNDRQNKKNIHSFEKYLDKKFANLGKYFQILLIKKAYKNKGIS